MSSEKEIRAHRRVVFEARVHFLDISGSIENAHREVSRDLEPLALRAVGRPVIEAADQHTMVLSWRVEQVTPPGDKPTQSQERAW